eukprot:5885403-Pyramimonas_sp.AAC.1
MEVEDEVLREELKLQAESLWAINDALKQQHVTKAQLMDLLEANAQVHVTRGFAFFLWCVRCVETPAAYANKV